MRCYILAFTRSLEQLVGSTRLVPQYAPCWAYFYLALPFSCCSTGPLLSNLPTLMQPKRLPQRKGMSISLLWGCIAAALAMESWVGLGPTSLLLLSQKPQSFPLQSIPDGSASQGGQRKAPLGQPRLTVLSYRWTDEKGSQAETSATRMQVMCLLIPPCV